MRNISHQRFLKALIKCLNKQADFQDAPEESLESNQENKSMRRDNPDLLSDTNHTVLIKEDKKIGVQSQAKVIHVPTKKKHTFVKPDPDQIAEARERKK